MRAAALVLTLLGAVLTSPPSPAEPAMTAGDLQQLCAGTDHVSVNACRIYILGVTQGITVGLGMGKGHSAHPCVPADVSAEELGRTIKARLDKRLAASPADQNLDAAAFIGAVLTETYPCTKPAR